MANRLKQDKHRNHCSQVILLLIHTTQKQFRRHNGTTYESLATDLLTVSHGAFFPAAMLPTGALHLEINDAASSLVFPSFIWGKQPQTQ